MRNVSAVIYDKEKPFFWKNDRSEFQQDEKWWMQDSTTSLSL